MFRGPPPIGGLGAANFTGGPNPMRRLGTLILFVGPTAPAYAGTGEDSTKSASRHSR